MNRIDRLFGILTLLQSRRYLPAERIAERFHISIRTVYRDIKALNLQGIPVGFEPARGYFVMQGYFLPPVSFSTDEANALLLMESMVAGFTDRSILTHYSAALSKVKAVLRTTDRDKLESLQSKIGLQMPPCAVNDYDYLSLLQKAITDKTIITLDYKNSKEEISSRQVEPIGLIFYAYSWHLIAWCHWRQQYRDFKISRVIRMTVTDRPFTLVDHMPIAEYMQLLPVTY